MRKTVLLATICATVVGCATARYSPELNPLPHTKFVIVGQKDPNLEAHFRIKYVADQEKCSIDRPYGGAGVVRTHTEDRLAFAAGEDKFKAEFLLDRYLPGDCHWRAQSIAVSVNLPPYNAFLASWASIISFDFLGAQGLEEVEVECLPIKPTSRAMWCKGPIANVPDNPGQIRVLISRQSPSAEY